MRARSLLVTLVVLITGCGPVIGDACTVNTECGKGVCLQSTWAPGGLCSLACTPTNDQCPAGSTCVTHAIDGDSAGCLRACTTDSDCRMGFVCRVERESRTSVCVGTAGIP